MSRSVRLRPWQHAALARFAASTRPDFLAVATPGAGKTTFALAALRTALAKKPARVIVVAPTAHLKLQWAAAASVLGLHLDPAWSPADGPMPPDMHGVVTSYQQVAMSAAAIRPEAMGAVVVLDEIHHAGEEQAWGEALREAFNGSSRRLALSGTPFRSDTRAIPFVRYEADEAVPDFEYGYGDALRDGRVVRPVYFPRIGGEMEWSAPDGAIHSATFDDQLAMQLANQRLRTALSLDGDWLSAVIREAADRLDRVRRQQPDAGGLVIALDQDHAKGIAQLLRREIGVSATVVTSDDPEASSKISAFAVGREPWLVAVRMVSEGVDIPRLRVGVYATTVTTDLFFRQAVVFERVGLEHGNCARDLAQFVTAPGGRNLHRQVAIGQTAHGRGQAPDRQRDGAGQIVKIFFEQVFEFEEVLDARRGGHAPPLGEGTRRRLRGAVHLARG